jgi:hypothetical protein
MPRPEYLIIVQRYQRDLYERLRREHKAATVLFDRRHAERRRHDAEPDARIERRRGQRRRGWTPEEQGVWSELRYLRVHAGGAARWTVEDETGSEGLWPPL